VRVCLSPLRAARVSPPPPLAAPRGPPPAPSPRPEILSGGCLLPGYQQPPSLSTTTTSKPLNDNNLQASQRQKPHTNAVSCGAVLAPPHRTARAVASASPARKRPPRPAHAQGLGPARSSQCPRPPPARGAAPYMRRRRQRRTSHSMPPRPSGCVRRVGDGRACV